MGANSADSNDGAPSRDVRNIDKTVMENFYKLVHSQPNIRLTAACSTYKILAAMKRTKVQAFNNHLNYCVERLVTGLASSRALARRGYATLLLELLKKNQVATERLFSLAQQKFGNISNETNKDNLLGYYLLINVVLESGNHKRTKQNTSYLEKMYKILVQLRDHKSYFDNPVAKLLTERYEIFYEFMLAEIPPAAFGSDARLTHNEILSLTLCNKYKRIPQLEHLGDADVLRLSEALTGDRLKRRPLHPVWVEWGKTLMSMNLTNRFESFMKEIVHSNFFKPNHNDLAALGLELVSELTANMDCNLYVHLLLNDYIIRLLIVSMRSKNSLSKHCLQFIEKLTKNMKTDGTDPKKILLQPLIFRRFISPPGSLVFDEDSKSKTLTTLLNSCHPQALKNIADHLFKCLDKKMSPAESKRALPTVGRLLAHLIRRPEMPEIPEFPPHLAKRLIVTSLFNHVDPLAIDHSFWTKLEFELPARPLDISVKLALRSAYHATMDHIVSSSSALQRITIMGSLVDLCHQLIHAGAVQFFESTGDITKKWQSYMVSLTAYRKLCVTNDDPKILYPISSLYLLYGLQIVEHGLYCKELIDDLHQAAKDALKNDPSDGSWADILTDQIIALLSATECNPWIRKLCVSVFGSLLPHISETSIDLLCDAIRAPLVSGCQDEDEEGEEEEDEEENEEGEQDMSIDKEDEDTESKNSVDGDEEGDADEEEEMEFTDGSDSDGEDSQSDEESISEEAGPPASKRQGKAGTNPESGKGEQNGNSKSSGDDSNEPSGVDSSMDDEEEEEEYLDDEQMMKLDSVLVDMFKMNRVGKKKKRDPSFKLRCLDLIKKVVTKKHNDAELIKKILSTLIPLAAKSSKSADTRSIAVKINTMIDKMPGKSKLNIAGLSGKRASRGATDSSETALDQQQLVVGTA